MPRILPQIRGSSDKHRIGSVTLYRGREPLSGRRCSVMHTSSGVEWYQQSRSKEL